jgi:hypothetical protein
LQLCLDLWREDGSTGALKTAGKYAIKSVTFILQQCDQPVAISADVSVDEFTDE